MHSLSVGWPKKRVVVPDHHLDAKQNKLQTILGMGCFPFTLCSSWIRATVYANRKDNQVGNQQHIFACRVWDFQWYKFCPTKNAKVTWCLWMSWRLGLKLPHLPSPHHCIPSRASSGCKTRSQVCFCWYNGKEYTFALEVCLQLLTHFHHLTIT